MVHDSAIYGSAMGYSAMHDSAMCCIVMHASAMCRSTMYYSALCYTAMHYSALCEMYMHCIAVRYIPRLLCHLGEPSHEPLHLTLKPFRLAPHLD